MKFIRLFKEKSLAFRLGQQGFTIQHRFPIYDSLLVELLQL